MKVIPDGELISPRLVEFATACGKVLARAHARTGDPVAIDAYMGKGRAFDEGMGEFALAYADQTERDHRRLADAVANATVESARLVARRRTDVADLDHRRVRVEPHPVSRAYTSPDRPSGRTRSRSRTRSGASSHWSPAQRMVSTGE